MLFAPGGPQSPRRRNRLKAIFLTIALVLALYFLFFTTPESPQSNSKTTSYAQQHATGARPSDEQARPKVHHHKELVVASMKNDDTSWLAENFPEWHQSVYVVDNKRAPLTVARNKGRESMVYLT